MSIALYFFFFQAEDGIRDLVRSRGLGDVYKRQRYGRTLGRDDRPFGPRRIPFQLGRKCVDLVFGHFLVSTAKGEEFADNLFFG